MFAVGASVAGFHVTLKLRKIRRVVFDYFWHHRCSSV
jgi:hypothetical protein